MHKKETHLNAVAAAVKCVFMQNMLKHTQLSKVILAHSAKGVHR